MLAIKIIVSTALLGVLPSHPMISPVCATTADDKPNIVFILMDDVGWNDVSYNSDQTQIRTPNLDKLSAEGVRFKQHYVHSVCTPSRAALLTGRYGSNLGLFYTIMPGSPTGLPTDVATLPQLLRNEGYRTAMVGKWHLGNSQWAQTPNGRGFEEFIGNYLWDLDTYTKQQFVLPWTPLVVDWVHAFDNHTYKHYAEPRHSTHATTEDAEDIMRRHAARSNGKDPLFLYVAYTAAHSPLQPLPQHLAQCSHITHLWRREFCGMMVGLDEGIQKVVDTARKELGENTIVYVVSDNGGSTWFGGLNTPLHGSKATPFQGGVLVPGFIMDFTEDKKYIGFGNGREYHGKVHIADVLPTLLGYAGVSDIHNRVPKLDGYNFGPALRTGTNSSPRNEVFVEMYNRGEFIFQEQYLRSYIVGDMKLIEGDVLDPNRYFEAFSNDAINCTDTTIWTAVGEVVIRSLEYFFGAGQFDMTRITLTHRIFHKLVIHFGKKHPLIRLYNISSDPNEQNNIAEQYPDVVSSIQKKLSDFEKQRPPQQKFWMQYHIEKEWRSTFKDGDCSKIPSITACKFTHPWIPDSVDPWKDIDRLTDSLQFADQMLARLQAILIGVALAGCYVAYLILDAICGGGAKRKKEKPKNN